jgi:hypothetical protein
MVSKMCFGRNSLDECELCGWNKFKRVWEIWRLIKGNGNTGSTTTLSKSVSGRMVELNSFKRHEDFDLISLQITVAS